VAATVAIVAVGASTIQIHGARTPSGPRLAANAPVTTLGKLALPPTLAVSHRRESARRRHRLGPVLAPVLFPANTIAAPVDPPAGATVQAPPAAVVSDPVQPSVPTPTPTPTTQEISTTTVFPATPATPDAGATSTTGSGGSSGGVTGATGVTGSAGVGGTGATGATGSTTNGAPTYSQDQSGTTGTTGTGGS